MDGIKNFLGKQFCINVDLYDAKYEMHQVNKQYVAQKWILEVERKSKM